MHYGHHSNIQSRASATGNEAKEEFVYVDLWLPLTGHSHLEQLVCSCRPFEHSFAIKELVPSCHSLSTARLTEMQWNMNSSFSVPSFMLSLFYLPEFPFRMAPAVYSTDLWVPMISHDPFSTMWAHPMYKLIQCLGGPLLRCGWILLARVIIWNWIQCGNPAVSISWAKCFSEWWCKYSCQNCNWIGRQCLVCIGNDL